MKLNLSALLAAAALSSALVASAVPAKRDKRIITQPDGTTLTVFQVGDEHNHFTLTDDNKLLIEDENGQFSYANINTEGIITSTKIKALDAAVRPASHASLVQALEDIDVATIAQNREKRRLARRNANADAQSGIGTFADFPKKGDIKGLIILVEFQDQEFKSGLGSYSTDAHQYFQDMMSLEDFSEWNATGCAEQYFREQSFDQFRPQFDVVGPYKLAHNTSYYGGNDSSGNDTNPWGMVAEACQLADDDVNFADYDNDGDGVCDNVFVFYAGRGEASGGASNTVWPHSYNLSNASISLNLDGVKVDRYACTNEWGTNRPDGVGTFVHEFSHVMGLPDLYNTTSSVYNTPCSYDALDYGPYNNNGCTPPAYSVFERNAMEWIDLRVLEEPETIELGHIADTNEGCIALTSKTNEFYLFENRQQSGWDKYIPGHGLIIWHIDYQQTKWTNNVVNNTSSHQCVDLVEASGMTNGSSQSTTIMKGWTWPGSTTKTEFTSETTPAFKEWNGSAIDLPITDIKEENGTISFCVLGGSPSGVPVPDKAEDIEKGDDYFIASWSPAEDATDYKLWVYAEVDNTVKAPGLYRASSTDTETADMGNGTTATLPDGWTTSEEGIGTFTGPTNCGAATPAAKLSYSDAYIQTREFDPGYTVSKVTFWMKGVGTTSGSNLTVQGQINGAWTDIEKFIPENGTGNTYTLQDMPDDVKAVKFIYEKEKGNISIDDIVITLQNGIYDEVLPDYNGILTGGETSVRVDKLREGSTVYRFKVASTPDGERFSKSSETVTIKLGEAGVNDVLVNNSSIDVNFRTITVNTDADRVEIFNIMGQHISSQRVSDGSAVFTLPTSGLYIVRAGNASTKVVVR